MPEIIVTQEALDDGKVHLDHDALEHDRIATSILNNGLSLPIGSVIAIQGPWGRGKTDVLARMALMTYRDSGRPSRAAHKCLWLNPWQYGTPDLLTPLVINLVKRIPPKRRSSRPGLRKAAKTIICAGINFGLKAAGVSLPGGGLLSALEEPAKDVLTGLFEAAETDDRQHKEAVPDRDPVSIMGERFAELVAEVLAEQQAGDAERYCVFIDDLDRCLPDRQVALLEAIHFLSSASARATFLIALDPVLAKQSVLAHYGTDRFDPDRYLDKIFELRVNLPALPEPRVRDVVLKILERKVAVADGQQCTLWSVLQAALRLQDKIQILEAAGRAFMVGDLRNPRILRRIFDRLYLLACSKAISTSFSFTRPDLDLPGWLLWLAIIERWPEVRLALQDAGEGGFDERWRLIASRYHAGSPGRSQVAVIERLQVRDESPELCQVVYHFAKEICAGSIENLRKLILKFDGMLVEAGL